MKLITDFLGKKGMGFYFLLVTTVMLLVGVICFSALASVSTETDEIPELIITLCVIALLLCLIACYKDFFKAVTLAIFTLTTVVLFNFIAGRVSYLAYYFSGDIYGTGLSPLFLASAVCFVFAFITSICTVCIETEKQ